ncbi:MAG: hypothetical protein EBT70_16365 [Betaproteobacteria bacterium]|nr:hypothetical protein [Betaproteobacteria bacterium]
MKKVHPLKMLMLRQNLNPSHILKKKMMLNRLKKRMMTKKTQKTQKTQKRMKNLQKKAMKEFLLI